MEANSISNGTASQPFGMSPTADATRGIFSWPGEPELDEPLAVEGAGHRFQNLDAALIVLDQLVVGRQDAAIRRCAEAGARELAFVGKADGAPCSLKVRCDPARRSRSKLYR